MKKHRVRKYTKPAHNFKYSGDITIKLAEDDCVYSTTTYHNTGCAKLFNFLTDCLRGDFTAASSSRPCRIVLFKANNTGDAGKEWSDDTRVSTKVFYDTALVPGATTKDGGSITYHFRIPYLCMTNGETIAKVALYPEDVTSYEQDRCAYFILPNPIEIPTSGGNFTVIIDWKLHIYNAKEI